MVGLNASLNAAIAVYCHAKPTAPQGHSRLGFENIMDELKDRSPQVLGPGLWKAPPPTT